MIRKLKGWLGVGALAAGMIAGAGGAEPWQVVTINKLSLEGTLREGNKFEVHIETRKPKELRESYFGAAEQPQSVIEEITVKVGGKKTAFPKPAFEDLANALLQTVSITSQPNADVKLRFTGGDASTTYEVEYFIEADRLAKRLIRYFEATGGEKREVIKTMTF